MILTKQSKRVQNEYFATGVWNGPLNFPIFQFIENLKVFILATFFGCALGEASAEIGYSVVVIFALILSVRPYFYIWSYIVLFPAMLIIHLSIMRPSLPILLLACGIVFVIAWFGVSVQQKQREKIAKSINAEIVAQKQAAAAEAARHKTCPHCAETILAEAKVCKHCGRDI